MIIRRNERGFTLLDILISLIVLAFGMLSLARAITRSSQNELEAHQRTQAMELVQDVAERISNNRKQAVQYVGDYIPSAYASNCAALPTLVARDQCEWTNRLLGSDALDGARSIGAPMAARACITNPAANVYIISIAWQGTLSTAAPESDCGQGAFDHEENRRVYSTTLQFATLGA